MEWRFVGRWTSWPSLCPFLPDEGIQMTTTLLTCMMDSLVNMAVSPGVKFKQSSMPFVQMENISHFLRACQMAPLSLPPHDVFLTVDLYEAKDPAQVLQCLGAFSRRANAIQPSRFPRTIGAKGKGVMSPQLTGSSAGGYGTGTGGGYGNGRGRGVSNVSERSNATFDPTARPTTTASGRTSPTKNGGGFRADGAASPPGGVTSWSSKKDESASAPAWNIHQYGYMGGASQGNQGIAFGARRQITSPAPSIPSLAEKERRRREEETENERLKQMAEEAEYKRRVEREAEEERVKAEEERRWEEETRRLREQERREAEEEKRRWEAEERRWKEEEENRKREERDVEARFESTRARKRTDSDARLNGQFLSQYQAGQTKSRQSSGEHAKPSSESERITELERQLQEAKEREQRYERERQERLRHDRHNVEAHDMAQRAEEMVSRERRPPAPRKPSSHIHKREDSWREDEREYLRNQWDHHQGPTETASSPTADTTAMTPAPLNVPSEPTPPPQPPRPLPSPNAASRPLPDPSKYTMSALPPQQPNLNRPDRFLSSNPAPPPQTYSSYLPSESAHSTTAEVDAENARRIQSTQRTKDRSWASKSLLEREMEQERERQREWEEGQKKTAEAAAKGVGKGDLANTTGEGGAWSVSQYGWMGGDSQNRGGAGLGVGGARRQIIGPRPKP
jgi:transgelin